MNQPPDNSKVPGDADQTDRPQLSRRETIRGMFAGTARWQLVFIVVVIGAAGAWMAGEVRQVVFGLVDTTHIGWAKTALKDPDDRVAAQACATIAADSDKPLPPQLIRTAYGRPDVAFRCLERATHIVDTRQARHASADDRSAHGSRSHPFSQPDAKIVPRHEVIASTVGRRWMTDLIEGSDDRCATARHARRALEIARIDPTYRLLSCGIGADSPEVRQCCVDQLGGPEGFAQLLNRPDRVPLREAGFDYRALVGASFPTVPTASAVVGSRRRFGPEDAADESDKPVTDGQKRFGELQFDVQDWVVDVGCRLQRSTARRRRVPRAFVAAVESDGCAPTSPPWQGMHELPSWSKMCSGLYRSARKRAYTPREALCGGLAGATIARTITTAKVTMAAATSQASAAAGATRDRLDMVADHFGDRLYGFTHGHPIDEHEEPESRWRSSGQFSPMGAW